MRTLLRDRPTLLIEAEERHRPGAFLAINAFLAPLGYRAWFFGVEIGCRRCSFRSPHKVCPVNVSCLGQTS